jgi:hypothetical protein
MKGNFNEAHVLDPTIRIRTYFVCMGLIKPFSNDYNPNDQLQKYYQIVKV